MTLEELQENMRQQFVNYMVENKIMIQGVTMKMSKELRMQFVFSMAPYPKQEDGQEAQSDLPLDE